jgi:hypothetical protein
MILANQTSDPSPGLGAAGEGALVQAVDLTTRKKELQACVKSIRSVDSQIKELQANNSPENDERLKDTFSLMSSLYATVILGYYDVVRSLYRSWDVHGGLWKTCFYKKIDDFRGSIKECNSAIKKLSREPANSDGKLDRAKHKLVRLVSSFSTFLIESTTFYQDLMINLEAKLNSVSSSNDDDAEGSEVNDQKSREELRHHVYKCLLFLGDLARYAAQNEDGKEKNFSVALRYYERAAFVNPDSGNPHNQMAVLAGYSSAECVAVFHYCRSILSKNPFTGGHENLVILFNKVKRQHDAWLESEDAFDTLDSEAGFGKRKSKEASKVNRVKAFLLRFTHLHGVLYERATTSSSGGYGAADANNNSKQQQQASGESERSGGTPSSSPGGAGESAGGRCSVHGTLASTHELMSEFEDLLVAAVFSDSLLMKMLVMCMFSIHINVPSSLATAATAEDGMADGSRNGGSDRNSSKKTASQKNHSPRYTGESVALVVMYEFVKKITMRVRALLQQPLPVVAPSGKGGKNKSNGNNNNNNAQGGWDSTAKTSTYIYRLIPVLNVFCDWVGENNQYLISCQASLNGHGRSNQTLYADDALIEAEGKSRSAMRNAMCTLATAMEQWSEGGSGSGAGANNNQGGKPKLWRPPAGSSNAGGNNNEVYKQPLKEHVELRGFLPMTTLYETYFTVNGESSSSSRQQQQQGVSVLPPVVSEEAAKERRVKTFRSFVKNSVAPCAQREVVEAEGRRLRQEQEKKAASRMDQHQHTGSGTRQSKKRERGGGPGQSPLSPHATNSARGSGGASEEEETGPDSDPPASFHYSPPSSGLGEGEGDTMETEEIVRVVVQSDGNNSNSRSELCDETESVLGEEVVFKPRSSKRGGSQKSSGNHSPISVADSQQNPHGHGVGFLLGRAEPGLAAVLGGQGQGQSSEQYQEPWGAPQACQEFLGEASWWSNTQLQQPQQQDPFSALGGDPAVAGLFGGVESSLAGLSLLQRVQEASSLWMGQLGDEDVEDLGGLVLPPPPPPGLQHVSSFGAGPPAAANYTSVDRSYTANPFLRNNN